jgi:hypothetical protein
MGNSLSVTQETFDLEKELSRYLRRVERNKNPKAEHINIAANFSRAAKVAAFDLLFSLSPDEQVKVLTYRAHRIKTHESIFNKHDEAQIDELARFLGHKDWREFDDWAYKERLDPEAKCIDPNKMIDTGKMVSDFIKGGQNTKEGVTLKRHLDQLFNGKASRRIKKVYFKS